MTEREMRSFYSLWDKAKRDSHAVDGEIAAATKVLASCVSDEARAQSNLKAATNAAAQTRNLSGSVKPAQEAAIAKAELAIEDAAKQRQSARDALTGVERQKIGATQAVEAALLRVRQARDQYVTANIEALQKALRSDRTVQTRLGDLHQALKSADDPSIGLRMSMTWEELMLETFPEPADILRAA